VTTRGAGDFSAAVRTHLFAVIHDNCYSGYALPHPRPVDGAPAPTPITHGMVRAHCARATRRGATNAPHALRSRFDTPVLAHGMRAGAVPSATATLACAPGTFYTMVSALLPCAFSPLDTYALRCRDATLLPLQHRQSTCQASTDSSGALVCQLSPGRARAIAAWRTFPFLIAFPGCPSGRAAAALHFTYGAFYLAWALALWRQLWRNSTPHTQHFQPEPPLHSPAAGALPATISDARSWHGAHIG